MPRFEIFPLWSSDHYVIFNDSSSSYIRKHYPKAQFLESKSGHEFCHSIRSKWWLRSNTDQKHVTYITYYLADNLRFLRIGSESGPLHWTGTGSKWTVFKQKLKIRLENLNSPERVKLGVFVLKRAKIIFSSFKWILLVTWWVNQSEKRKLARFYHMYPITVFAYLKLLFRQCHTVVELVSPPSSKNNWTFL